MNGRISETEVLVVGAGPTGLMLAHELGLAGVETVVIDALPAPSRQSRGGGVQPRTAEILDLRGMTALLRERSVSREAVGAHFGGLPVSLECHSWNTRYPCPVLIPQDRIEEYLARRIEDRGIAVRRGHTLTALDNRDDRVVATVQDTGHDAVDTIECRYLVACDGAHSTARRLLDMPFPGLPGTRPAVLADVRLTSASELVPTTNSHFSAMVRDAHGFWAMLNPIREDMYRLVYGPLAPAATEAATGPVAASEVREVLHAVWGTETTLGEVLTASRFTDATRQLESYRVGRVLFAGDAAHIHPPLGGQGLNLGIQDAFNLGWKLAARCLGRAPDELLDTYHAERHPVAARVIQHTRAQRVLAERNPSADVAALREIITDLIRLPDAHHRLAGMVSGLDVRYPMPGADEHPLVGARMPDIDLVVDGVATRFSDLTHHGRGLFLDLGEDAGVPSTVRDHATSIVFVAAGTTADLDASAVLVRPDGHVCWRAPLRGRRLAEPTLTGLAASVRRWFGG